MTASDDFDDKKILRAWRANASPWTRAVREQKIESRRVTTDQAIVDTIVSLAPERVLDIGCGEGWLARALSRRHIAVTGIDGIQDLVNAASQSGGGRFRLLPYEQLGRDSFDETFDLVACNFSLLGKESVERVFRVVPDLLAEGGHFVVQTLHPVSSCGEMPYVDGWRQGTWAGIDEAFSDPAPWYFRTVTSWRTLFRENGFTLVDEKEPPHPVNGEPVSLLMVAARAS